MCRPWMLLMAVLLACGCKGQSPPGSDPFFGRTTVPAPGTGAASGRMPDPYYRNSRGAAPGIAPPNVQLPAPGSAAPGTAPAGTAPAGNPAGTNRFAPPGGNYNYQGAAAGTGSAAPTAPARASVAGSLPTADAPSGSGWSSPGFSRPESRAAGNNRFAGSPASTIHIPEPARTNPADDAAVAARERSTAAAADAGASAVSSAPSAREAYDALDSRSRVVRTLTPRPAAEGPARGTPLPLRTAPSGYDPRPAAPPENRPPIDLGDAPPAGTSARGTGGGVVPAVAVE